jgi:hypothetical protein
MTTKKAAAAKGSGKREAINNQAGGRVLRAARSEWTIQGDGRARKVARDGPTSESNDHSEAWPRGSRRSEPLSGSGPRGTVCYQEGGRIQHAKEETCDNQGKGKAEQGEGEGGQAEVEGRYPEARQHQGSREAFRQRADSSEADGHEGVGRCRGGGRSSNGAAVGGSRAEDEPSQEGLASCRVA